MGSRSSLPLLPAAVGEKQTSSSGDGVASSSIIHHTSSMNSSSSSRVASTTCRADIPAVTSLRINSTRRCFQSSSSHSRTLPQRSSSGGKDIKQINSLCSGSDIGGGATACNSSRGSSHNVGNSSSSVRGCNGSSSSCGLKSFNCSVGSDSAQWSVYHYSSSSSNTSQWREQQSCNSDKVVKGLSSSSSSEYPQGSGISCTGGMRGIAAGGAVDHDVALTTHLHSIEEVSDRLPVRCKAAGSSIQRSKSSSSKSFPKQNNSHKEEQRRNSCGAARSSKEKKSSGMSRTSVINSSNRRRIKSRRSSSSRHWSTTEGSSRASTHREKECSRCSNRPAAAEGGASCRTAGKQSVSMSSSSSKRRSKTSAGQSTSSRISPGSTNGSSSNRRNCSSAFPNGTASKWKSAVTQGSRSTGGTRSRSSSSRSTRGCLQGNCSSGNCSNGNSSGNRSSESQCHSNIGAGVQADGRAALTSESPGRPRKGAKPKKPQQQQQRPRRLQRRASQQQRLQQQQFEQEQKEEKQQRDMLLALVLDHRGLGLHQQMGHLHPEEDEQQQQSPEAEAEQDLVSAAAFLAAAAHAVSPDEASVAVSPACGMGVTPCLDAALSAASPSVLSHYQPSAAVTIPAPLRRLFSVVCGCTAARRPAAAAAAPPPAAAAARQARWPVPGTVPAALGAAALPSSAAAAAALAAAAGLAAAAATVDDTSLSEDGGIRAAAAAAARAAALPASAAAVAKRRRAASAAAPAALQTSQIAYLTQQQQAQDRRPRFDSSHGSINRLQQRQHEWTTAAEEVPQEAQLQQLEQNQQRAKWQQTAVRLLKSITSPPAAAADRESSLFVFDLDDTLIPTEWIRSAYEQRKQPTDGDDALYVYRDVSRDLNRMTDFLLMPLILRTLLKAKAWSSTVAIVTNARSSKWLSIIDSMFPELMMLLRSENIPVIRSSPAGEEPNALCIAAYFSYWMNAKKTKFEELLFYHFQKYPSAMTKRLDIISVGDNDFEEYAATFLALEVPTFVRFAKVVRCQTGLDPVDFIGQLQDIGEAIDRVCVEQTTQPAAFVGNSVMYRIQGWDQP